jgi:hypothetical protein
MPRITVDEAQLKTAVRKILREVLVEDRKLLHKFISEVAEDLAFGELIEQGRKSKKVPRAQINKLLKGKK